MGKNILPKTLIISFLVLLTNCNGKRSLKYNLIDLDGKKYDRLEKHLDNKTIVGIGESTHGDGGLFELKTEIIEYLHEELGFEAVLMESDFLATDQTMAALNSYSLKNAANMGIQETWANSQQYSSILKYISLTIQRGDTLHFHGFDSQMTGVASLKTHLSKAQSIKDKISVNELNILKRAIRIINTREISRISLDSLQLFSRTVKELISEGNEFSVETDLWLKNIKGNMTQLVLLKTAPAITAKNYHEILSHPNYIKGGSIRDSLMYFNVKYYLKKYDKVVIWAANNHLKKLSDTKTWMGDLLYKSMGDKYYSILAVHNQGEWSYPEGDLSGVIPPAANGTLTSIISNMTDSEVAFLDIKTTELSRLKVRDNNWITTDSIEVGKYCDAILYVRTATGSTMIEEN